MFPAPAGASGAATGCVNYYNEGWAKSYRSTDISSPYGGIVSSPGRVFNISIFDQPCTYATLDGWRTEVNLLQYRWFNGGWLLCYWGYSTTYAGSTLTTG
jgi:hypothetical protein